jgi:class 3 adenylate cyclase
MEIYRYLGTPEGPSPRFVEGRIEEVQELFGLPLPTLPEGQQPTGTQPIFLVELHPRLKFVFLTFLEAIYRSLGEGGKEGRGLQESQSAYLNLLLQIATNVIENERRSGLLNLFWLAHSQEIANTVQEYFSREAIRGPVKYQIHPMLRGFYRNLHKLLWRRFTTMAPLRLEYSLGTPFNHRLIESLFDDQLPLTEGDVTTLRLETVLVSQNRRFRLSAEEYRELTHLLRERLRLGFTRQDVALLELIKTHLPTLEPSIYKTEAAQIKMLFHPGIVSYLFTDADETTPRLSASRTLKAGRDKRGGWHLLFQDYLDLIQAVRRFEVIHRLRRLIALTPPGLDEIQLKQYFAEGRLFRFLESTEVLNSARKITILFADLRGFTAASEGGISEVELTRSVYTVLDPVAAVVKRFGGRIDKFTGDGAMITFGTTQVSPEDELNALRTALTIQDTMQQLRAEGKTSFRMGISLHTGRAQIGRFVPDESSVDVTVIGRHVNIAGRLSGSGGRPWEADEEGKTPSADPEPAVWLSRDGTLYNQGIVATQEHVEELGRAVDLKMQEGERGATYTFFDEAVQKKVLIEYVGDAKFKGVERAHPIYRVVAS